METETLRRIVQIIAQVEGLDKLNAQAAAAEKLAKGTKQASTSVKELGDNADLAERSFEGYANSLRQTVAQATTLDSRFKLVEQNLRRLEQAGKTGSAEWLGYMRAMSQLRDEQTKLDKAANASVDGQKRFRFQLQNTAFQLTDIAVSMQAGQRPITVLAQQIPQLLGAFGAFGAIAGLFASLALTLGGPLLANTKLFTSNVKSLAEAGEAAADAMGKLGSNIKLISADEFKSLYEALTKGDKAGRDLAAATLIVQANVASIALFDLQRALADPFRRAAESANFLARWVAVFKALWDSIVRDNPQAIKTIGDFLSGVGESFERTAKKWATLAGLGPTVDAVVKQAKDASAIAEQLTGVDTKNQAAINQWSKLLHDGKLTLTEYTKGMIAIEAAFRKVGNTNAAKTVAEIAENERRVFELQLRQKKLAEALQGKFDKPIKEDAQVTQLRREWLQIAKDYIKATGELTSEEEARLEVVARTIDVTRTTLDQFKMLTATAEDLKKKTAAQLVLEGQLASLRQHAATMTLRGENARTSIFEKQRNDAKMLVDTIIPMQAELAKVKDLYGSLTINVERYRNSDPILSGESAKALEIVAQRMADLEAKMGNDTIKSLTGDFRALARDGIAQVVDMLVEAKGSFSEFAATFLKQIAKMIAQQAVFNALRSTPFGKMIGLFANGAAFAGTTGLPYGVYDKPTYFPMPGNGPLKRFANGGVLGEAGAEAIMPLKRGSGGRLGVEANINLEVINRMPGATIQHTRRNDGTLTIEVIEQALASKVRRGGSAIAGALQGTYGLNRAAGATS